MVKNIKICYIGGGSKLWARIFMSDLALAENLGGEIALYDIDKPAAERNAAIGKRINEDEKTLSKFNYVVYDSLDGALSGADFVVLSILPGTFKEMRSDVHAPEKYGIFQSVGDTVGPGGVLRSMRTVPLYEGFAKKIKEICPNAWVINFTNPMSICVKTLYDVFPEIKAFGCCHEVFHAQQFLCCVLKETRGVETTKDDIYTDACGVNHFTWITEARHKDYDLLALLPEFMQKHFKEGYYEYPSPDGSHFGFLTDPFAYGNKVKMDLFKKYGALAAAGDRHLVEFMNNSWYLSSPKAVKEWKYNLTSVDWREADQKKKIEESIEMAEGRKKFNLIKSSEIAVDLMKAIMGFGTIVSNVNMPNLGQMPQMPKGSIVETNCIFSNGQVKPIVSNPLPTEVKNLVYRNCVNIDSVYEGIKERDLNKLYLAFANQPLCSSLSFDESKKLFKEMCYNTSDYLTPFFNLDEYFD